MSLAAVTSIVAVIAVLSLGGVLTKIGPWYESLKKPVFQPPGWLFAPAWSLIGGLTAWSAVVGWRAQPDAAGRATLIGLFAINAVFNVLWSYLFFTRRRPDFALIEVVLLWASILALLIDLARVSGFAAWLISPYLAWVTFAAFLNLTIVRLNPHPIAAS